jgi:hypothetical protein
MKSLICKNCLEKLRYAKKGKSHPFEGNLYPFQKL